MVFMSYKLLLFNVLHGIILVYCVVVRSIFIILYKRVVVRSI